MTANAPPHVWVILSERGAGRTWADFAFWGVAETYEAALGKLQAMQPRVGFHCSYSTPDDVTVYAARSTWRIRKVAL